MIFATLHWRAQNARVSKHAIVVASLVISIFVFAPRISAAQLPCGGGKIDTVRKGRYSPGGYFRCKGGCPPRYVVSFSERSNESTSPLSVAINSVSCVDSTGIPCRTPN